VVVREADASGVTEAMLAEQVAKLTGDIYQMPPMVSAKKIDGVPLYKRARKGQVVERQARIVHIYEFRLDRFDPPCADFRVRCSKGTYVRTLCADIGEALGCGAHLSRLRRRASGTLSVDNAFTLEQVLAWDLPQLESHVLPMSQFI
jgi:tRNA pseudouridine55 synthase